jgi:t-SNARE complex subunit (syntaxin)
MARDITNNYLIIKKIKSNNNHYNIEIEKEIELWFDNYNNIIKKFNDIEHLLNKLSNLQKDNLIISIEEKKSCDKHNSTELLINEINAQFDQITQMIYNLQENYKKVLENKYGGDTDFDRSFLANMEEFLTSKFKNLKSKFIEYEKKYYAFNKLKENKKNKFNSSFNEMEEKMKKESHYFEHQLKGLSQQEIENITYENNKKQEEEKAYAKINNDIKELYFMQEDLHTLILNQGTVLDTIEHNMNISRNKITQAKTNLIQAREIQHKTHYNKFCCYCILFIVLLFILAFTIGIKNNN